MFLCFKKRDGRMGVKLRFEKVVGEKKKRITCFKGTVEGFKIALSIQEK